MTSETIMQVLMVYPDARCIFCEKSDVWCVVKTHLGETIGEGDTQFEAWDDAASRLTETKLPSSPAGASECQQRIASTICGYPADDPIHGDIHLDRPRMSYHPFVPPESTPDPLGADISGPKGSGGAAPDEHKYSLREIIGLLTPCMSCHHTRVAHCNPNDGCVFCPCTDYVPDKSVAEMVQSAAPIAPAAQELVEELRVALAWALPLARLAMESHRQLRLRAGHTNIGDGRERNKTEPLLGLWDSEVDSIDQACAALARAERKEGEAKHG